MSLRLTLIKSTYAESLIATWAPFFDDGEAINFLKDAWGCFLISCMAVDAIIFLAPISGFDQVLAEDKTVNRLVSYIIPTVAYVSISYMPLGRLCITMESSLFK